MEQDLLKSVETRHKKEKKILQAQIQALKKTAKSDKTKKKDILLEIAKLEIDLENRHKDELEKNYKEESETETVIDNSEEVGKIKISKAQKRRDKKLQQEKDREEQIKLQEKENLLGPRNTEIKTISSKLKDLKLTPYQIPSDGDCLYKAVAHQLEKTRNINISVDKLRSDVANYITQNKEDFLPFMSNFETGDMLTDIEFSKYCDNLKNTKVWGGQLEIRALSNLLKCPIIVVQASSPGLIEQGLEFEGPPLVITYYRHMYSLGEHYNSTQELSEDVENGDSICDNENS